jgi:hypothetical protein
MIKDIRSRSTAPFQAIGAGGTQVGRLDATDRFEDTNDQLSPWGVTV